MAPLEWHLLCSAGPAVYFRRWHFCLPETGWSLVVRHRAAVERSVNVDLLSVTCLSRACEVLVSSCDNCDASEDAVWWYFTLDTEHLPQLESGASDFAESPDDSLSVGFGEEGARVQDGLLIAWETHTHTHSIQYRWHWIKTPPGGPSLKTLMLLSSPCCWGFKLFFATSAIAPRPRPTARPAETDGYKHDS